MSITTVGSNESALLAKLDLLRAKCAAQRQRPEMTQISADFVNELVGWPAHLRDSIECVCSELATRPDPRSVQAIGENLKGVFCVVEGLLDDCRKNAIRSQGNNGLLAKEISRLATVQDEVVRLWADSLENWPWPPTAEDEMELSDEGARGEHIALEDAFAEIAGMDRPAWLAKVEARRKELQGRATGES